MLFLACPERLGLLGRGAATELRVEAERQPHRVDRDATTKRRGPGQPDLLPTREHHDGGLTGPIHAGRGEPVTVGYPLLSKAEGPKPRPAGEPHVRAESVREQPNYLSAPAV